MTSCLAHPVVERAQPWLGTLVSIRTEGLPEDRAHEAIHAAFEEVATVHRLMSFHEPCSDISRLNRAASGAPLCIHPNTFEVLERALAISAQSEGCFDITVGAELVEWGLLPRPFGAKSSALGTWRDIELLRDHRVVLHRPVWIDVGGIAKGYAVDRAIQTLRSWGAIHTVVNAGGDIRVDGEQVERVGLAVEPPAGSMMPVVEVAQGSIASSSGQQHGSGIHHGRGPHLDGIQRCPAPADRFVCVMAEECIVADALTKVVMARGAASVPLLRHFEAAAYLHDRTGGWQHLAGAMQDR